MVYNKLLFPLFIMAICADAKNILDLWKREGVSATMEEVLNITGVLTGTGMYH